nr:ACT domain-containing protein ACR2 isoform X2 [Ipomoea batatas]
MYRASSFSFAPFPSPLVDSVIGAIADYCDLSLVGPRHGGSKANDFTFCGQNFELRHQKEYFIRHVDGCALSTESEKERVIKCLEAAMERRVCDGVRLELCANNRVGLLSDITRVLRENGLSVVRADVATRGSKAVNIFYVRDISGNDVDIEFVKSIKREMGAIDLAVMNETATTSSTISPLSPRSHGRMFCYNRLIK